MNANGFIWGSMFADHTTYSTPKSYTPPEGYLIGDGGTDWATGQITATCDPLTTSNAGTCVIKSIPVIQSENTAI